MTVFSRMPCWYYDKKDLKRSPSILDGISTEKESRYRREGARFIINVGTKMGLRYDTMATGVVYFHRFYMFHSFQTFPRYITACCCLFLAGKVEETPKKCKDIIKVAKSFLTDAQFAQFGDDPKEEVMTLERILLQTIKFDLQVDHPYGHLLKYAKCLKGDKPKLEKMVQMAWTFINDSLCTTLCLQWEPEVIAIALMYLAGKLSKFEVMDWVGRIPKHTYWWDMYVQGMTIELLEDICHQVLDLYSTPVPDTPHDSPPATPPTKTTIRKVNPASPGNLPSSPVAVKSKEVMIGQPIPRLEPGELKRKTSKANSKKDGPEAKIPAVKASSSAQSSAAVASVVSSPKKSAEETEVTKVLTPEASDTKKSVAGRFIPTIETAAYHTGVSGRPPKTVTSVSKIEVVKDVVTKTAVETAPVKAEKSVSSHLHNLAFVTETADTFYAESHPSSISHIPFPQNASYMNPHRPLPHDSVLIQAPPTRPPPPTQYEDIYRPPPVPSLQPVQPPPLPPPPQAQYPPPPVPNIRPINQYASPHVPPLPPPPQPQTVMPNVSLPPPNLPQMPLPPPVPSNARNEHMHGPVPSMSGPPPPLPHGMGPSQTANPHVPLPLPPSHFMPRSEPDSYGRDLRNEGDHLQNQRMPMPVHGPPPPPRYMREGMPPSMPHPDFGHYDHERPGPHYRQKPEYEREQHHRDDYREYDDYGPSRGPPNPYEYDNMMRRRYDMEQQQQQQQQQQHHHVQRNLGRVRPPMMINNQRPRLESPTGIPPVRITGSSFDHYPE